MVHGRHESASKGMPIDQGDSRHGEPTLD
jgi:hypothetical protein